MREKLTFTRFKGIQLLFGVVICSLKLLVIKIM